MMSLANQMLDMGRRARDAAGTLRTVPAEVRSAGIRAIAAELRRREKPILAANAEDVAAATELVDRLRLDPDRLEAIAASLEKVAALPDPVGAETARWHRPNGLDFARVRTPIGVIGMIFESRPNVAADAAALCLRSGNALILRGGSDALRSCLAIHEAVAAGLGQAGLPADGVQIVPTADRDAVGLMLAGLGGAIDLIIPRGGKALVARVEQDARVPVLGHLEGICHSYVHASADPDMAVDVLVNAKMRRVSVCGATETLLIDREVSPELLPRLADALGALGCELRGDVESRTLAQSIGPAGEADWTAEYLAPILAVRIVADLNEAIAHIRTYGSGHTDAIIASDAIAAETFLDRVDSAIVMWNASTQFADGGEFGFGAEIGIATGRLHARGPVGPEQLTTFKYIVRGTGQVRP
ncbi:MAG: glutamate-5-semialdehyde dehydrogenase [Allosphingosinicella sp.]